MKLESFQQAQKGEKQAQTLQPTTLVTKIVRGKGHSEF